MIFGNVVVDETLVEHIDEFCAFHTHVYYTGEIFFNEAHTQVPGQIAGLEFFDPDLKCFNVSNTYISGQTLI